MSERIKNIVATMPSSAFSLVMATGILSIVANLLGFAVVSGTLFILNKLFFLGLCLQLGLRVLLFPGKIIADLTDHQRSVGFFTIVAGTAVLGNQFVILESDYRIGFLLWALAFVLWIVLTYAIFTCLTVKQQKPSLAEGIHGGWLVSVVATQSISVLSALLSIHSVEYHELFLFLALVVWLGGGMLYIWIISLIFYRYTFFVMAPGHLTPPYWINMGAMAISTLAGTFLITRAGDFSLLTELAPFVKGMTLLCWATASWWIPMLLTLGFWRHVLCRVPVTYDPVYWSMVFPLGMYAAATFRIAKALSLPMLLSIPKIFFAAAMLSWLLTLLGLLSRGRRLFTAEA